MFNKVRSQYHIEYPEDEEALSYDEEEIYSDDEEEMYSDYWDDDVYDPMDPLDWY